MRRLLLYAAACLFASGIAMGQACTSGPSGGTQCPGPLTVTVPTGGTKATAIELTPQTTGNLCPSGVAAKDGTLELCSQKTPTATLLVDYGDGKGYQSISVPGVAATVAVGTVTTLTAGSAATVTNSGTPQAAVLNFGLPRGDKGADGTNGTNGKNGTNGINGNDGITPQVSIGQVVTLPAGTSASVDNVGIPPNVVLNIGIPQGQPGSSGTMTMPAGCDFQITKLDDISHTGHVLFLNCQ